MEQQRKVSRDRRERQGHPAKGLVKAEAADLIVEARVERSAMEVMQGKEKAQGL
jgi:hypothetical protein